MKTLYYLEFAQSVDDNNKIIPAKKLHWYTPIYKKVAYEDPETCLHERYDIQENLKRWVVRVAKAKFFKNIHIRISDHFCRSWTIVCERKNLD